jgi:ribosomal protein L22
MTDERDETTEDEPREAADDAREGDAPEADASAEGDAPEADASVEGDAPEADASVEGDAPEADATPEADAPEAESEDAPEDAPEDGEAEEKPKRTRRRRASAETAAAPEKPAPKRRTPEEQIVVRAQAKYVRTAPRKARLVVDHIRGVPVEQARAILTHTPRAAAQDVLKVLNSAVANAEHNHELDADELVVHQAYVDEGPTLKRYRPRAQGRATRIRKRTSHLTIAVANKQ